MKRLVFFMGEDPDFQKQINDFIFDEKNMVLDITMLEWDRMRRQYTIGLVVEEQEKPFRQNCLVLKQKKSEDLTRDLDDFSEVMGKARNVPYEIDFIRTFQIRTPGRQYYYAYVIYRD